MITFISCVDILAESINQLHRVFINKNSIPFKSQKNIFHAYCSDREFFKTIRAVFAAHPINLKNVYGGGDDEKWFASWSGGTFIGYDFGVVLYSNDPSKELRRFIIKFEELFEFAKSRYEYLTKIKETIEKRITDYCGKLTNETIHEDQSDPIKWITTLIMENKRRWDSDLIDYELQKAQQAFVTIPRCELNETTLKKYRNAITQQLIQIQGILQRMEFEAEVIELHEECPEEYLYAHEKLFSDDIMALWGAKKLQEYLSDVVDLSCQRGLNEIQTVARAGLWLKAQKT